MDCFRMADNLWTRPGAREWAEFFGGGVRSVAFFCAITITTGPQYIGVLHKLFRI
jgi:hypothetical protein